MSPYAILGVSTSATDQEIKHAYRRLVKRYHPDRQSSEASHDQIAAINDAYDILSDPVKRAQYDRSFAQIFVVQPEDPVEAYKREFKRQRWEREKQEKEETLARRTKIYKFMRLLHVPILAFALGLVIIELVRYRTVPFFYMLLCFNAGYIVFQGKYGGFAFRLSFYNLFLFIIVFLYVV